MSRLVDGLLVLARAERAQASRPDLVDLDELLAERVAVWEPLAAEHGVALVTTRSGLRARCTPDRLDTILDNLLANAIDVSPDGGTVTLLARSEPDDGRSVGVHVVDEGPGMVAEQRERAFDRFWRAAGRSPGPGDAGLGGSGLGLAIVRRLAEADGGTAELRDAPAGGLDATILLRT